MKAYISTLEILGTQSIEENPLPIFRDSEHSKNLCNDGGSLLPEELDRYGEEIGYRVLPYKLQDRFNRDKKPTQLKTIVLENDVLKAVFLPEYGGRLYSLTEVKTGKELLFSNKTFQPATLALRKAWFSGGIEWNIGHFGHAYIACSPLFFGKLVDDEGNDFIRLYEFDRIKNIFWQIDFHLPKGSKTLNAYVKIINDNDMPVNLYYWANTAVQLRDNVRIASGTDQVMYLLPRTIGGNQGFGHATLPNLPVVPDDKDPSYPLDMPWCTEYFFQNPSEMTSPWEAAAYKDGYLFFERSSQPLRYRKMFCWGRHQGGKKWCDYLSLPNEGDYVEVQAGLAPTQTHGFELKGNSTIEFVQMFGSTQMEDTNKAFVNDWNKAKDYIYDCINQEVTEEEIAKLSAMYKELTVKDTMEILHCGSGWGALEVKRRQQNREKDIPAGYIFPESTIMESQYPWISLLEKGTIPAIDADELPVSWLIDMNWLEKIQASIEKDGGKNFVAYLHLGVMLYENDQYDAGIEAWKKSIALTPNPIAYRNIAYAMKQKNNKDEAIAYMEKSYKLGNGNLDKAFAEEYMQILIDFEEYAKAWELFEQLPESIKVGETIRVKSAVAGLELEKFEHIEEVFKMEPELIQEGDNTISELWFKYEAIKLAKERNVVFSKELLSEVKSKLVPPVNIDFRLVNEI